MINAVGEGKKRIEYKKVTSPTVSFAENRKLKTRNPRLLKTENRKLKTFTRDSLFRIDICVIFRYHSY